MGQQETRIEPSQAPGYNPELRRRTGGAGEPQPRRPSAGPRRAPEAEDPFFRYADVRDHIRPVWEEEQARAREPLEGDISGTADVQKLLEELGGRGKGDGDEDEEGGAVDERLLGLGANSPTETSEEEDVGERGIFHHEVKEKPKEALSVFSAEAHLIAALGDCVVGETLVFKDLSSWASQFPVHRIQWYIGDEIGTQVTFRVVPATEGSTLQIDATAVGRYIQVVATRRVEQQLRRALGQPEEGGVFDPHVRAARHVETGAERLSMDVQSVAVVGPVAIPDSWAYTLMSALAAGQFACAVKLRDEVIRRPEGDDRRSTLSDQVLAKIPAHITVTFSTLDMTYDASRCETRQAGDTSLFSLEWLRQLIGLASPTPEALATQSLGTVVARLPFKSTAVRPGRSPKTIVLATPRHKEFRDLVRFDVDPSVGRDVCLYALLIFQAARRFRDTDTAGWKQSVTQGELYRVKELLQYYLEDIAGTVAGEMLAYEEVATEDGLAF